MGCHQFVSAYKFTAAKPTHAAETLLKGKQHPGTVQRNFPSLRNRLKISRQTRGRKRLDWRPHYNKARTCQKAIMLNVFSDFGLPGFLHGQKHGKVISPFSLSGHAGTFSVLFVFLVFRCKKGKKRKPPLPYVFGFFLRLL